jgi:hypothetical protein
LSGHNGRGKDNCDECKGNQKIVHGSNSLWSSSFAGHRKMIAEKKIN